MQGDLSHERNVCPSACLSVCQTRELWPWAVPAFCLMGAAWGQTEGHRGGQQTRANASLSEVDPQYLSEAYPELSLSTPFHYKIATRI